MALLFYPDDINKSQERTTFQEDSSSPSLVSNQYFITFRPIQYDVEVMDFEYHEEKAEFENYDFVINIPEQFDVLSADNFQALLDIIIPYAAEHGRLEDASGTQQVLSLCMRCVCLLFVCLRGCLFVRALALSFFNRIYFQKLKRKKPEIRQIVDNYIINFVVSTFKFKKAKRMVAAKIKKNGAFTEISIFAQKMHD